MLRMAELHRKYGQCTNSGEVAAELEEAATCLQRLCDDDYYGDVNAFSHEDYKKAQAKAEADLDRFCELFKRSRNWWE